MTRPFTYLFLIFLTSCQDPKPGNVKEPEIAQPDSSVFKEVVDVLSLPDYDTTLWSEILPNQNISLDLKYASEDNFLSTPVYDCPRCFLAPEMARAVLKLSQGLYDHQYRLVLFDCYRPISVQKVMWSKKPDLNYVTPPDKGSMHNRGLAIDMGLTDLEGNLLDMGSEFDEFSKKSHWTFPHEELIMKRRTVLRELAEEMGLLPIRTEWWHYSMRNVRRPISNFEWSCP